MLPLGCVRLGLRIKRVGQIIEPRPQPFIVAFAASFWPMFLFRRSLSVPPMIVLLPAAFRHTFCSVLGFSPCRSFSSKRTVADISINRFRGTRLYVPAM